MLLACLRPCYCLPTLAHPLPYPTRSQVAHYSMRVQANVMYVLSALGLTDAVRFLGPVAGKYAWPANATLEPTGFPAWGQAKHDEAWRR